MHLIVIIIALLAERTFSQLRRWREMSGFARYVRLIERWRIGRRWLTHPSGVLVVVPPVLVVGLIQWAIAHYLWIGFELAFGVVILMLMFGPRDLWEDVYALANARDQAAHDEAEARAIALCRRTTGRVADDNRGQTMIGAVLVQGHERVLAVLLWYFVAGPAGALFYRSVRELPSLALRGSDTRAMERTAEYVHGLAAWVPARIVAVVYALAGHTLRGLKAWPAARASTHASAAAGWRLLDRVGRGALDLPDEPDAQAYSRDLNTTLLGALGLISRALLIVLAGLAVLTIFGVLR